jgi:hypothetical protein
MAMKLLHPLKLSHPFGFLYPPTFERLIFYKAKAFIYPSGYTSMQFTLKIFVKMVCQLCEWSYAFKIF